MNWQVAYIIPKCLSIYFMKISVNIYIVCVFLPDINFSLIPGRE